MVSYNLSMKRKLIFFGNDLRIGGIENALVNLINSIDGSKYEVTLVLENKNGELLSSIGDNVIVEQFSVFSSGNKIIRKARNYLHRLWWKYKNKNKYDFSCAFAPYSFMGCDLAKSASKNSSIYIHTDYSYIYKNENEFKDFFESRKIDEFRTIIFVSENAKDNFITAYPNLTNKTTVINNLVNVEKIELLSKERIDDEKKKEVLLLFVGRLEDKSKKVGRLLETMKYLKEKEADAELWIVGDGPDRYKYEEYIIQNNLVDYVSFKGMQMNPYPYIKKADYIVLTSDYEGYPVVYQESMCLKKKIITTLDITDGSIVIPGKRGYIVSKDVEVMKKQIYGIITDDKLKYVPVDMIDMNKKKMSRLERVFDGRTDG